MIVTAAQKKMWKEYLKKPFKSISKMSRTSIEEERLDIVAILPKNQVKALSKIIQGAPAKKALRDQKVRYLKNEDNKTLIRRYYDLSIAAENIDVQAQMAYSEGRWLQDQLEILNKSLGREKVSIMCEGNPMNVSLDNLTQANKAQENIAKRFNLFRSEIQGSNSPHNVQINIQNINSDMSPSEASRIYRDMLGHE